MTLFPKVIGSSVGRDNTIMNRIENSGVRRDNRIAYHYFDVKARK
jgi:hypothetical protein